MQYDIMHAWHVQNLFEVIFIVDCKQFGICLWMKIIEYFFSQSIEQLGVFKRNLYTVHVFINSFHTSYIKDAVLHGNR